jgi:hypothetical protein
VIRELAALSPMELWLDEGLSSKRVTAKVERATLKHALEELFEKATDVNYVFAFDRSNPERVTKIYAGSGGGGRLGREPTVTLGEEPADLDSAMLDGIPEAAESPDELVEEESEGTDSTASEPEDPQQVLPDGAQAKPPRKEKPPR